MVVVSDERLTLAGFGLNVLFLGMVLKNVL